MLSERALDAAQGLAVGGWGKGQLAASLCCGWNAAGLSPEQVCAAVILEHGLFTGAPWEIRHIQAPHCMALFPAGWWGFLALENHLIKNKINTTTLLFSFLP